MFDDGKRKPVPTQEYRHPKTGQRIIVNHNDKRRIDKAKARGFKIHGPVRERGCARYEIR